MKHSETMRADAVAAAVSKPLKVFDTMHAFGYGLTWDELLKLFYEEGFPSIDATRTYASNRSLPSRTKEIIDGWEASKQIVKVRNGLTLSVFFTFDQSCTRRIDLQSVTSRTAAKLATMSTDFPDIYEWRNLNDREAIA